MANRLGTPIEAALSLLPAKVHQSIESGTKRALNKGFDWIINTMTDRGRTSSEKSHKFLAGLSGGVGGAFGAASLVVELPISTGIILHSVADIARSEGHELNSPATRLACLEVLALGGRSTVRTPAESNYWLVRTALSRAITEAAAILSERGLAGRSAPAIARLLNAIASRFGILVSEQVAAKLVPVIGAAGGAAINWVFTDHFQRMARGHFIVKRLEKTHGQEAVQSLYLQLAIPMR